MTGRDAAAGFAALLLAATIAHAQGAGDRPESALAVAQSSASTTSEADDPDIDFARRMIAHHQGGIEMARALLDQGKDAALRRSAEKMIVERQKEIGDLQLWLQTHRRQP